MLNFNHFIRTGKDYFVVSYDRSAANCRDTDFLIIASLASGELKGAQEVGVAEGVFEPIYTDAVTDECKSEVDQAVQDITDGKIDFTQYFSEAE